MGANTSASVRRTAKPGRSADMAGRPQRSAAAFIRPGAPLDALRSAAAGCTGCDLYKNATQTVFGEGAAHARVMLVGEQPGDYEDRAGQPFVGPAGRLLDKALAEAGIDRSQVYVTNVVKHFKWIERGKKRIHQKPRIIEIRACLPWLQAEIERVQPDVVVCLGATATQALLGKDVRVTRDRGRKMSSDYASAAVATVHPSSLLRMPLAEDREREYAQFVKDLRAAASAIGTSGAARRAEDGSRRRST